MFFTSIKTIFGVLPAIHIHRQNQRHSEAVLMVNMLRLFICDTHVVPAVTEEQSPAQQFSKKFFTYFYKFCTLHNQSVVMSPSHLLVDLSHVAACRCIPGAE